MTSLSKDPVRTRQRGNVLRLAVAQMLAGANSVVIFATAAIIGYALAPSPDLATLPISIFVVGMAVSTLPAGRIAHKYGRQVAFLSGTACGVAVGLIAAGAILMGSFWLFCFANLFAGAYAAVALSYRFAVTDGMPATEQARAMGYVLTGGVLAGLLGAQLVTVTMDLWPGHRFAATYVAQAAIAAVAAVVVIGVKLPRPSPGDETGARPLRALICQPGLIVAMIVGAVSYALMNFLMTSAPLAMRMMGHSQAGANIGLQWHVMAMYAPSFFTGSLIARFGAPRVSFVGLLIIALSVFAGMQGTEEWHFWLLLVLLGVGWNFGFIGASGMVLNYHTPSERTQVQSFNDFVVFGTMAVGSFLSGTVLARYGWDRVLLLSLAPAGMALAILIAAPSAGTIRRMVRQSSN